MTNTAQLYLRLLKRCLTRDLFPDGTVDGALQVHATFDRDKRQDGSDWPSEAETMAGMRRLDNLQNCIESVIEDGIAGDLVETGVWRGGCGILMRGVLAALNEPHKTVWLADSFEGLPEADPERFPQDRGDSHATLKPYLGVTLDQVKENVRRYELLDHRVRFLPGWFRDTLPTAPIESISVLRLDGDMYESTFVALESLYPRLTPGGYIIVDDYGALPNCKAAVEDYRRANSITEPILEIDWTGVYWRRFF